MSPTSVIGDPLTLDGGATLGLNKRVFFLPALRQHPFFPWCRRMMSHFQHGS